MSNQSLEQQLQIATQKARQSGIGGTAYIYTDPANGSLKLKLDVVPPESREVLISNFASALAQGCQMFGIQVKMYQTNTGETGSEK